METKNNHNRTKVMNKYNNALKTVPDIRKDKIYEVKEKLMTGFYERDEVFSEVARILMVMWNE